jgi:hypothetical protein
MFWKIVVEFEYEFYALYFGSELFFDGWFLYAETVLQNSLMMAMHVGEWQ